MNKEVELKLLSSPAKYLLERTKELYDKCWYIRYFNDMSWVYGISDQELLDYEVIYKSVKNDLLHSLLLEDKPLANVKLKNIIDSLPDFQSQLFVLKSFRQAILRGIIAFMFFPYGLYLIIIHIKKTNTFKNLLSDIIIKTECLINLIENETIEEWLTMEEESNKSK